MPYNTNIPGQINEYQMRAIEIVARAVPRDGHVVEVGSLFGASSWAWAKSVDASVTVHCIDPWEGNRGIAAMEERLGISYGLEQFKIHTADCPNIRPHQGYSPRDFQDWDQPIDLYYEDAVHTDPILSQNLDFWGGHLTKNGIMCGDDHRGRFPDVRDGARRKAGEMGRHLIVVESFWCLFPEHATSPEMATARAELEALAAEYRERMHARGPHAEWGPGKPEIDADGRTIRLPVSITQKGLLPWPRMPAEDGLTAMLTIRDQKTGTRLGSARVPLGVGRLDPDIPHAPVIRIGCEGLDMSYRRGVTLTLRLIGTDEPEMTLPEIGIEVPAISAGARASRGMPAEPLRGGRTDLTSREFMLQFSRKPETFGVRPKGRNVYELERPDGSTHAIRSTLQVHEIALCYALAGLIWDNGAIVDLWPLQGASTWAFARGLSESGYGNPGPVIHAFDSWNAQNARSVHLDHVPTGGAGSILGCWTQTLEGYHHLVQPHQGDVTDLAWDGRPIGILAVGSGGTATAHDHVVRTMFPCLRPGSILIHNDYARADRPLIHLEMARLGAYFEPCYTLRGTTRFYRCVAPIPEDVCATPATSLDFSEQVRLLDEARASAEAPVAELLGVAAARHALQAGDRDRTEKLLSSVRTASLTENGLQDFSYAVTEGLRAFRTAPEIA